MKRIEMMRSVFMDEIVGSGQGAVSSKVTILRWFVKWTISICRGLNDGSPMRDSDAHGGAVSPNQTSKAIVPRPSRGLLLRSIFPWIRRFAWDDKPVTGHPQRGLIDHVSDALAFAI